MNIIHSTFYSVFYRDAVDKKVQFFNVQQLERLTEQLQQVCPAQVMIVSHHVVKARVMSCMKDLVMLCASVMPYFNV